MFWLSLTFLLIMGTLVESFPLEKEMILTPEQEEYLSGISSPINAWLWSKFYWKQGELVYNFGEGLSASDQTQVRQAMTSIASQTCIKFRLSSNPQTPKVIIQRKGSGCWSYVGYLGWLSQPLNLGIGCMSRGTIQHELLHALGFVHMHSDPNRDQFVKIAYENIRKGAAYNFEKYQAKDVGDFGLGYDYNSVMHYGPIAFSKNRKPTIKALHSAGNMGQRKGLSQKDVLKLKQVYCTKK